MIAKFILIVVIAAVLCVSIGLCTDYEIKDLPSKTTELNTTDKCTINGKIGQCTPYYLCSDDDLIAIRIEDSECPLLSPCCPNKLDRPRPSDRRVRNVVQNATELNYYDECTTHDKIGQCTPYYLCNDTIISDVPQEDSNCPLLGLCCLKGFDQPREEERHARDVVQNSQATQLNDNDECTIHGKIGQCIPYYLCNYTVISGRRLGDSICPLFSPCCLKKLDQSRGAERHVRDVLKNSLTTELSDNKLDRPKRTVATTCGFRQSTGGPDQLYQAKEAEFPWTVVIFLDNQTATREHKTTFQCGASLVHSQVVLTAAHCVQGLDPKTFYIRAGIYNLWQPTEYAHQDRSPKEIIIHENYLQDNLHNDIALIILQRPVTITENVNTICLPPLGYNFDRNKCFAVGWGQNSVHDENLQSTMKKRELSIVPLNECQTILKTTRLGRHFRLHKSFVCAGGETDTCIGDGGSPLMCPIPNTIDQFYQAGIVSWGVGCNEYPGIYVNVAQFREWIDINIAATKLDLSNNGVVMQPPPLIRVDERLRT